MKIYYQTTGYTCAPACALIVLEHFGLIKEQTEELESEISRKSSFSDRNPSSSLPLLAVQLLERGLKSEFNHEPYEFILKKFTKGSSSYWRYKKFIERYSGQEGEAKDKGLIVKNIPPTLEGMISDLDKGSKILALVKMGDIPHCVVLNSFKQEKFEVFCPIQGVYSCSKQEIFLNMASPTGRAYLTAWK